MCYSWIATLFRLFLEQWVCMWLRSFIQERIQEVSLFPVIGNSSVQKHFDVIVFCELLVCSAERKKENLILASLCWFSGWRKKEGTCNVGDKKRHLTSASKMTETFLTFVCLLFRRNLESGIFTWPSGQETDHEGTFNFARIRWHWQTRELRVGAIGKEAASC